MPPKHQKPGPPSTPAAAPAPGARSLAAAERPTLALALAVAATASDQVPKLCAVFLETLVRGADLEQAAIWLLDARADFGTAGAYPLVGAFPSTRGLPPRLAADNPLTRIETQGFQARLDLLLGLLPDDDALPSIRVARLGDQGFLLARRRSAVADDSDLEALKPVLPVLARALANALEIAHLRTALRAMDVEQARRMDDSTRLSALIDSFGGGVLVEDEQRRIVLVNREFCAMFAVPGPPEAMLGLDSLRAAEQSKALFKAPEVFVAHLAEVLSRRRPTTGELLEMADGRVLERDILPVRRSGQFAGNLWLYRDATARRKAQAAIEASEARKRAILSAALDAVITTDQEGRILEFNPAAERIFGHTARTVAGRSIGDLFEAREPTRSFVAGLPELAGEHVELTARRHDGGMFPAEMALSATRLEDGQGIYTAYVRDITERLRTEEQLRAAKRLAEDSAQAKQLFLANMSHEIRTPLNAVIGMTHLLAATALDVRQKEYLDAIGFSADTLLALINDILDLSKIESGRIEFESTAFDLHELAERLVESLRGSAARKGLTIGCEIASTVARRVQGDPMRLKQILFNLLGNAIKFTERGGVTLALRTSPTPRPSVQLVVSDTGPGIAEEKRAGIFDAFSQERSDTARRYGGTGLGLAIVRQLVERQGGVVRLESELGRGSTFVVELPLQPAAEAPAGPPRADQLGARELVGVRVLLVEDNEINQLVATRLLEAVGAKVTAAMDGVVALERLRAETFDIVLMDIRMPRLDGFETTRRIRHDLGLERSRLPIVALTASALLEEKERALAAGMDDFILKPFAPDDLYQRIRSVLRRPAERPAAAAAEAGSAIELRLLEERALGQRDFLLQLIDLFVMQTQAFAGEITDACSTGDGARVGALAHRFKSSATLVGALRLAGWLDELERRAADPGTFGPITPELAQATVEMVEGAAESLRALRDRYEPRSR